MEVFGAVAAGVTLGAELLRLSRCLRKMINGFRYARSDVAKLAQEMEIFSGMYDQFMRVCVFESKGKYCNAAPTKRLVSWAEETIVAVVKLLSRVSALVGNAKDSVIETVAAHVKWYFSENEVKCLRLSLSVARESINGFTNIRVIEKLDEEMDMLRATRAQEMRPIIEAQLETPLEIRLRMLKQMKNNCRGQRHAIDSRSREARVELLKQYEKKIKGSDIVPEPRRLLRFTSSVDQYVEKVLPMQESGRRRRTTTREQSDRSDSTRLAPSTDTTPFSSNPSLLSSSPTTPLSPLTPPAEDHSNFSTYCPKCSGTCRNPEAHGRSVPLTAHELTPLDTRSLVQLISHRYNSKTRLNLVDTTYAPDAQRRSPSPRHSSRKHGAVLNRSNSVESTVSPIEPSPAEEERESEVRSMRASIIDVNDDGDDEQQFVSDVHGQLVHKVASEQGATFEIVVSRDEAESDVEDEDESDEMDDVEEEDDDDDVPSPFHPVAGVRGSFPPHWRNRHKKSE